MTFQQPLSLQYILVNTLSGNTIAFTFIAMIAIASLAAYFRMTNATALIMIVLFAFMMNLYIGGWMVVPILIIVGFFAFNALSRIWKY